MSVLVELPRHEVVNGLKLKRKLGEKIVIHCGDSRLVIQVAGFHSGHIVQLAFDDPRREFEILREEIALGSLD